MEAMGGAGLQPAEGYDGTNRFCLAATDLATIAAYS